MTKKQQAIKETRREIALLEEKLAKLEALPDGFETERLIDMPSYPGSPKRRVINALRRGYVETLDELLSLDKEKLLRIHNLGPKGVQIILDWMKEHNYVFYAYKKAQAKGTG